MNWTSILRLRLRSVFSRRVVEQELDEELQYHLHRQIDKYVAAGMSPEKAHWAAKRSVGDIELRKEECRDTRRVRWLEDLAADTRYGIRSWLRTPAFAATAILTIGIGIGANTAVFNLLDALLFRPLPVLHPDQLVRIGALANNGMTESLPGPLLEELRTEPLLHGVCGVQTPLLTITLQESSFPVSTHALTGDCYQTLGVHAALGRLLTLEDDRPHSPHVVVLSYGFWQDKFAKNPNALGQTIRVDGRPFTIIGITESRFHGLLLGFPPGISIPVSQWREEVAPNVRQFYWAHVFARLRTGATSQQLHAKLASKWPRLLESSFPLTRFKGAQRAELIRQPVVITSGTNGLDYSLRDHFRKPLFALLALSALVLLVGCLNVANLLIARGLERRREIAVRLALGARRGRIARQMIAESVLLLLAGCALALFLTYAGDHLLLKALSDFYTGLSIDVSLNFRILLFTMSLALLSLVLSGILPAWQASDLETGSALKSAGRSVKGGRAGTRKVLISGQVALTMVLVMGASLLTQTLRDLRSASLGFSPETTLDAQLMPLPRGELPGPAAFAYFTALLDQVRSEVGVTDASLTSFSPLFTLPYKEDIRRLDLPDRSILQAPAEFVSDGFMRTMRIQILQGEDFRRDSHAESQKTAIISKTLTKRLFGDGPALGRHIRFGSEAETQDLKIIGIAADARLQDPRGKELSFLYLNLWQLPNRGNWGNLQIRYSGSSGPIVVSLRQELRRNGHQYAYQTRSLETQHELSLLQERVLAALGATFGVVGLALAAIGIYGLLSFFVGTRQAEFGLRMALGARPGSISWMVIKESCVLVGVGVLVGLPICYFVARMLSSLIDGMPGLSVTPLILSAAVLLTVAGAATVIPVYRASSVDPVSALRSD